MKSLKVKEKGMTLIALVVTIIVLMILATISISIFFADNGLFSRAFQSKKWHEIEQIREKLEIEKEPVFIDNLGKITIEEYLKHIVEEGLIKEEDIENTENEDAKYITVEDKYIYLVEEEEDGNIKITYQGEVKDFKPGLEIKITKVTTNSITVKANGRRMDKGEYEYYIKNIATGEEYKLKKKQKEDEYIYEGLIQNTEYQVKVLARNQNGEVIKESNIIRTIELESLQTANITFIYNPSGWTNKDVTVKANVSQSLQEGTKIQTSKDAKAWSDDISQVFETNGIMYVRIYDGVNESNYCLAEVTKIDKEKPIIANAVASTTSIAITGTDSLSGIIGYAVTTSSEEPIEETFTQVTNTQNLNITKTGLNQATTYYVWLKDEAGNISASKQVTTSKQAVTGISLNKTNTTIYVGNTETLTATITPSNAYNKNLTWTTSNSGVATVSNGKITAKAPGTATITATASDGSGKKATCTVTVRQLVTGISLSKTTTAIFVGSAETIKATVSPSNASNKEVTWTTSNSGVATVSNGTITAKAVGTATITATAADGSGKKATCTVTVKDNKVISNLKPGEYIYYDPGSRSYTSPSSANGYRNQSYNSSGYKGTWRVLTNNGSSVTIIPSIALSSLQVDGKTGYDNFISELNNICKIFIHPTYATSARVVGYGNYSTDVANLRNIGALNIKTQYWLGATYTFNNGRTFYCGRMVDASGNVLSGEQNANWIYYLSSSGKVIGGNTPSYGIRPIVTLKPNAPLSKGTGTSGDYYQLK